MKRYTRRQLMVMGTGAGMGLVGVLISIPALGFLLSPLFTKRQLVWIRVGPIDNIPIGQPTPLVAAVPNDEGPPAPPVDRVVYVVRQSDGTTLTLSNICSHMQCDVHWSEQLQQFLCPCHGGLYDITGKNIGGPPPQPLPRWVSRITVDPVSGQHVLEIQNQLDESI
jgi:quinol---cytochrome c reductase iron-sulfur subunit, bacillus type